MPRQWTPADGFTPPDGSAGPPAPCNVPLKKGGDDCGRPAFGFDTDWDAYECADHLGWWQAQGSTDPRIRQRAIDWEDPK